MMDIYSFLTLPLLRSKGVEIGSGVKLRGIPQISRLATAKIVIGDRVVLNSRPLRYHAHMHSPVKLLVDAPGAVIEIGEDCRLNGTCIHAMGRITIGRRCLFAANSQIIDSNAHLLLMDSPSDRISSRDVPKQIVIEDDVWVGLNAIVLPGSHIGAGSVIGAGVVVSGIIPPRSLVRCANAIVTRR